MTTHINLWECLTNAERTARKYDTTPRVTSEDLRTLGQAARFYRQELSVEVTEDGWLLRLFSCDVECYGDEVVILIPKDGREPVEVKKDRIGKREYHHG